MFFVSEIISETHESVANNQKRPCCTTVSYK